jgi:hypothetical protein
MSTNGRIQMGTICKGCYRKWYGKDCGQERLGRHGQTIGCKIQEGLEKDGQPRFSPFYIPPKFIELAGCPP